jgi:hypothetical protein
MTLGTHRDVSLDQEYGRQAVAELLADLDRTGYAVKEMPTSTNLAVPLVLRLAREIGELFIPGGCDVDEPVIRTAPTHARDAAPFDRPQAIGWHGDFATYVDRPEVSLVYITRPDPRGGEFGAWRLASVERVLAKLRATPEGREAFGMLRDELVPFSYADDEEPRRFRVIDSPIEGRLGLRFYLPSIRRGCEAIYGEVPPRLEAALATLEHTMDEVAEIVPTRQGSLLVVSNWFGLHDRVRQSVSRTRQNREALLCFVGKRQAHSGQPGGR